MADQKTIVLTGVTRGLGRALCEAFIAEGHTVFGCGRSKEEIESLSFKFPPPHDFAVVDLANVGQLEKWAKRLVDEKEAPDFLINNAALMNHLAPLWEVPEQEFSDLIDVNIKAVANAIRIFVPAMIQRGKGIIVNFSSGWGQSTAPEVAPYCTSKYAIEGMTKALAQELPEGLAAIPLSPGVIHTEMLERCFGENEARAYADPEQWVKKAAPFILDLSPRDSGRSLRIP